MSETMTALVERNRAFLRSYREKQFGDSSEENDWLASADGSAADTLLGNPPGVRDKADLVAAISFVVEDAGYVQPGHKRILEYTLTFLTDASAALDQAIASGSVIMHSAPAALDMSGELSQLKTLAAMANDLASGIAQVGMGVTARAEMGELIALLAALRAFAGQAYDDSKRGAF